MTGRRKRRLEGVPLQSISLLVAIHFSRIFRVERLFPGSLTIQPRQPAAHHHHNHHILVLILVLYPGPATGQKYCTYVNPSHGPTFSSLKFKARPSLGGNPEIEREKKSARDWMTTIVGWREIKWRKGRWRRRRRKKMLLNSGNRIELFTKSSSSFAECSSLHSPPRQVLVYFLCQVVCVHVARWMMALKSAKNPLNRLLKRREQKRK